jgi:thiol-disulfide isomerase/thioredoxin
MWYPILNSHIQISWSIKSFLKAWELLMRYFLSAAILASTIFVGCDKPAEPVASSRESVEVTDAAETSETALMTETEVMAPEVSSETATTDADVPDASGPDLGDWLELPEGLPKQIVDAYPTIVASAMAGDSEGKATLGMISQQIGTSLMQKGNQTAAYPFFAQAGKALRMALKDGFDQVPMSRVGPVFYNEACALAKAGQTKAAFDAVSEAVQNGFTDMELLTSDEDLAEVRAIEGFDAKLAEWKQLAAEKVAEHAREELAGGETFPFTFASTDIAGNEQSLEALKGKVVIVDVWGTWCPPCRAEIPSFIKLQEKFGEKGFQMVGLNYERKKTDEENLAAVVDYVTENGINYPCIMGDDETQAMIPNFQGFPTTLFIDRTGKVRMKAVGLHDYEYLDAIVTELLAE